jgi:LPXTG-motif cell wall-anchored protein
MKIMNKRAQKSFLLYLILGLVLLGIVAFFLIKFRKQIFEAISPFG